VIQHKQRVKDIQQLLRDKQKKRLFLLFTLNTYKKEKEMKKQLILGVILLGLFVIFLNTTQVEAARPLQADSEIRFVFQLLQRGQVIGSGPNGCTNIPGGSGTCRP